MKYKKKITVDSDSSVAVDILDENNNNCGHKWYLYGFFSGNSNDALKKRIQKANKWGDERIEVLLEGIQS